jgi:hypothetical protein
LRFLGERPVGESNMKDAHGYGSNGRGAPGSFNGIAVHQNFRAPLAGQKMRLDRDFKTPADRAVYTIRQQLASAQGEGHKDGLMQGLKNLLGG